MSKALGKGLSALIPDSETSIASETSLEMDISKIQYNRFQPRLQYNPASLEELKNSIRDKGVLQPILVRSIDDHGGYEVVAGERRLRAAQELNLKTIPVLIRELTDQEALVIALVENIQREQLNPIEEAEAFQKLIMDFSYTPETVAAAVGKDRSTITNFIRLLKLPPLIKDAVSAGNISVGHARALLALDKESAQIELLDKVIRQGLSVREVEKAVKFHQTGNVKKLSEPKIKDSSIVELEDGVQKLLGTKVNIQLTSKGGHLTIDFYSMDDLKRIIEKMIPR
jgi:ParB family transcriptional regulator, chromosome partitioning protein